MGQLEESSDLTLDFTKLEKVGAQVAATRAAGAAECDPGVIPVAVQNADTKEVILVAYTNEFDEAGRPLRAYGSATPLSAGEKKD